MEEVIAAILGLILYWFFTQKKSKPSGGGPENLNPPVPPQARQRKVASPPPVQETFTPPPMPEPEPFFQEDFGMDEPEEEEQEQLPSSFEELLNQFTAPTPKPEPRTIDEPFERQEYKSIAQRFQEERGEVIEEGKSMINERDKKTERDIHFKINRKGKNKYASILQHPESARDAFILKEVFDRKYF